MNFENFMFFLIVMNVFAQEDQPSSDSSEAKPDEELWKKIVKKFNLTLPTAPTLKPILGPMVGPMMSPSRPETDTYEFQTIGPLFYPSPTSSPVPHTVVTATVGPINLDTKDQTQINVEELIKRSYKGCISLIEGVVIIFTSLFQDGGLLAANGLLSLLLYPLGSGGAIGKSGIISQLLYYVFRKDGFLGPQGILSILIGGLTGGLKLLESEGLSGIGYNF